MGELLFGQAVEVGDQGVQFGAETGALVWVGYAILVGAQADFLCQGVELRRRAISCAARFTISRRPGRLRPGAASAVDRRRTC